MAQAKIFYESDCNLGVLDGPTKAAFGITQKTLQTKVGTPLSFIGEDRLLGGVDDDDAVRRLASAALCIFLALCNVCIAQSGELFLAVHPNHGVVGSGRKKVAPLLL